MSRAEQIGEYAIKQGIRVCTRPCWHCDGVGKVQLTVKNDHGNLEERVEACGTCEGNGEFIPHWNDTHVQLFVLAGILSGMNECREREEYVTAWDLLDWALLYIGRCFQQGCKEQGTEKVREFLIEMAGKIDLEPPEVPEAKVTGAALSPKELEDLVG